MGDERRAAARLLGLWLTQAVIEGDDRTRIEQALEEGDAEHRRLVSAWLQLCLADPSSAPDLLEWLRGKEGQLARQHANAASASSDPRRRRRRPLIHSAQLFGFVTKAWFGNH
jgi:hypothetical protein